MSKRVEAIYDLLRDLHLLGVVGHLRYRYRICRLWLSNRDFRRRHPDFVLPPKHLVDDACGSPNWVRYYHSGVRMAKDVAGVILKYADRAGGLRVLEWGCGPGRIIRHLPGLLGDDAEVYASDYNAESIRWCREHVPGVRFDENELKPPLPYASGAFDAVYAYSVLTHLSAESCVAWVAEIARVLRKDGVFFFTTHGDATARHLLAEEKRRYAGEGVCVRGKVQEGKKMFSTCHHPDYVRNTLLAGYELVRYVPPGTFEHIHTQDAWIARKR